MLTELEAKTLYNLLNKRFKKYMSVDNTEDYLAFYANTLDNIKRTASYLTKYADHQNLSESISHMDIGTYGIYRDCYANTREIEFAGCYRGKAVSQHTLEEIKKLFKEIHCDSNPPEKLYEFKSSKEVNTDQ
jgi:hypothetical protein